MSTTTKAGIGIGAAVLLVWILPFPALVTWILTAAIIGVPVALWFTLPPEQRRRIQRMRSRGQIGR